MLELLVVRDARNPRLEQLQELASGHGIAIRRHRGRPSTGLPPGCATRMCWPGCRKGPATMNAIFRVAGRGRWPGPVLVLDGVTDPHNLGACLRSAAAASATAVIVPRDHSAPLNAAARKAAAGAAGRLPLLRDQSGTHPGDAEKAGVWLFGLDGDAESLYQHDLGGPLALVLGAEGRGMRRLTRKPATTWWRSRLIRPWKPERVGCRRHLPVRSAPAAPAAGTPGG